MLAIGLCELLEFNFPTENPPITRCFQEINKFNSSKYRLFFTQNQTIFNIFEECNNHQECQPAIRICSKNENSSDELWNVLIPLGVCLLSISFLASWLLQLYGYHYSFVKFLIRYSAIETKNFANAFIALRKNRQFLKENIEELGHLMQEAVEYSIEKKIAVSRILRVAKKENITDDDEKLLLKNLSLLTSTASIGSVWNFSFMHHAVEKENYGWFSLMILFGGECGAKNGRDISSINMLMTKTMEYRGLLEECHFVTRWLINRAMHKYNDIALHNAASKGDYHAVEMLIANSFDVNSRDGDNQSPLHIAARKGHLEIVQLLIDNHANKEAKDHGNSTPLLIAVLNGHFKIVKFLVKNGANQDAKEKNNATSLHVAASKGNLEMVKFLVFNGADRESKTNEGAAPLHLSVKSGRLEVVKFLVKNGANQEAKDKNNATSLHVAASIGNLEIVKYLVKKGAEKEAKTKTGYTPLHLAAESGHHKTVKFLIENGANKKAKTKANKTPLDLACQEGHNEIIQFLKKRKTFFSKFKSKF
jgi:ankyrin repeat protein